MVQSELALWTFVGSTLLTYLWQSRKRFFLFNIAVLTPIVVGVTVFLSWALLFSVILGRLLFSQPEHQESDEVLDYSQRQTIPRVKSWKLTPQSSTASLDTAVTYRRRRRSKQQSGGREKEKARPLSNPETPEETRMAYFWQRRGSLERKLYGWHNRTTPRAHA